MHSCFIEKAVPRTGGRNVDGYPRHHFHYFTGGSSAPLWAAVAGAGEWITGCFRQRFHSSVCAIELITHGDMQVTLRGEQRCLGPGEGFYSIQAMIA